MSASQSFPRRALRSSGNALVISLLALVVLLSIGLTSVKLISTSYITTFHSAAWEDALRVAETGIDLADQQLNSDATIATWGGYTGSAALSNWSAPPYPNMASAPPPAGTYNYRKTAFSVNSTTALPTHAGEGASAMYAVVRIDPLNSTGGMYSQTDYNNGTQVTYRVRSTGIVTVPGSHGVTYEKSELDSTGARNHLSMLRRFFFVHDKTSGAIPLPQAARTVEVILQPTSANLFARSLTTQYTITMSGGSYTDSYDSTNPSKSTGSTINGVYYGQWDLTKRQMHGDIATDSAGNLSNLMSTYVYGSAYSNTGNFQNETNVQGGKYTNFDTVLPPVIAPTWSPSPSTPTLIKNTSATLTAGTQASPMRYKLSEFTIGGSNVVTINNPTPGTDAYVEIWVTGSMTISGSSYTTLGSGVHATFYVAGTTTVSGSGIANTDKRPSNLIFYGITPSSGTNPTFTVSGSATFQGVVDAPAFNFVDSGQGDFSGAIIARSANLSGGAGFHYDESLNKSNGSNSTFQMVSWIEDTAQLAPQP